MVSGEMINPEFAIIEKFLIRDHAKVMLESKKEKRFAPENDFNLYPHKRCYLAGEYQTCFNAQKSARIEKKEV